MSNLLLKISSNKLLAFDLRPAILLIYDDHVEYKGNQGVIGGEEVSLSYNQIAEVDVKRGFIQSSLTVVNTGGQDDIKMGHLLVADAESGKKAIEQQLQLLGRSASGQLATAPLQPTVSGANPEIAELNKLLEQGIITAAQYEQRKVQLTGSSQQPASSTVTPPTPPAAPPS